MSDSTSFVSGGSFSVAGVVAMLVGLVVCGYGPLLVPASVPGGVHVAAIGVSLVLS